jgi:hypothetical protein
MKYETKDFANEVINNLTAEEVELLEMKFWHNMTFVEMGKELVMTGSNAQVKLNKVLKRCRLYIVPKLEKIA